MSVSITALRPDFPESEERPEAESHSLGKVGVYRLPG